MFVNYFLSAHLHCDLFSEIMHLNSSEIRKIYLEVAQDPYVVYGFKI